MEFVDYMTVICRAKRHLKQLVLRAFGWFVLVVFFVFDRRPSDLLRGFHVFLGVCDRAVPLTFIVRIGVRWICHAEVKRAPSQGKICEFERNEQELPLAHTRVQNLAKNVLSLRDKQTQRKKKEENVQQVGGASRTINWVESSSNSRVQKRRAVRMSEIGRRLKHKSALREE